MMEHKLTLLPTPAYRSGWFVCNLCWEKGSGAVYHCSHCRFDLHPHCAATEGQHTHFSHYQHPLKLTSLPSYTRNICDLCGERVSPQVYRCDDCDYEMHSLCVRAPRFLQHRSHKHALTLMHKDQSGFKDLVCDGCGDEVKKMTYRCTECNFDLHPSCVMLPVDPLHFEHPSHRLRLLTKPSSGRKRYICKSCGLEGRKWVYNCESCSIDLHPQCVKVVHQIASPSSSTGADSHEHGCSCTATRRLLSWAGEEVAEANGDSCVICLDGYDGENPKKHTSCGHHFHLSCILGWLERKDECPICRRGCNLP